MNPARHAFVAFCLSAPLSGFASAQTSQTVDVSNEGAVYIIRSEAVLSASPRHIWATLTDCARGPEFVPHLESCRVIDKDPAGRWDVRENVAKPPFVARIKTIVRSDYAAMRSFTYKLVSGDLRVSEGSWTISPVGTGAKVTYVARFEPNIPAPGFLIVSGIRRDLPEMFSKLESVSRALAGAP